MGGWGRKLGRVGPLGGMCWIIGHGDRTEVLESGIWGKWAFLEGWTRGLQGLLYQRQRLRLERPGLEAEPRLQDVGTSQNGREVKARPGVRVSSLASAPRVLVMARVALEPTYGWHLSPQRG